MDNNRFLGELWFNSVWFLIFTALFIGSIGYDTFVFTEENADVSMLLNLSPAEQQTWAVKPAG